MHRYALFRPCLKLSLFVRASQDLPILECKLHGSEVRRRKEGEKVRGSAECPEIFPEQVHVEGDAKHFELHRQTKNVESWLEPLSAEYERPDLWL